MQNSRITVTQGGRGVDFENQYGKLQIFSRDSATHIPQGGRSGDSQAPARYAVDKAGSSVSPQRAYAEWYLHPAPPVVTAEHFKQLSLSGGRASEANLWGLIEDVLHDAERKDGYQPEAIGIASVQPHRRWFVSHYAHIQDLLQRHTVLRRANIICGWLERTYRETNREARLTGQEDVVLRQLLLTYLRGGELHKAVDAAVTYRHCALSCALSAAQLQTVREPWFTHTALVPLFGEYGNSEVDQAWSGNEHRLDNLSQLFEESISHGSAGRSDQRRSDSVTGDGALNASQQAFDAVIGAALCGNLEVLEPAFAVNGSWRDIVWCHLRCALVVAFTKTLMTSNHHVEGAYANYIIKVTGADDHWQDHFIQRLVAGLTARLRDTLPQAPLQEQLQMRFILHILSPEGVGPAWMDIRPEAGDSEAPRLITHTLLVLDGAYRDTHLSSAVQVRAGGSFASSMAQYAENLALLPKYPFDEGMQAIIAMATCLRSSRHRAEVYSAFILSAREYELERGDLKRDQLEEQEAQLVRLFVEADSDPLVRAEVQHLLNEQVDTSALLTHNPLAERIMWEAMHANTTVDCRHVLLRGLEACVAFWLSTPQAELDAITDVSGILTRRVLPQLTSSTEQQDQQQPSITEMEQSEVTFWYLFGEARGVAKEHARIAGELAVTRTMTTGADRTILFQLAQDEAALLLRLISLTQRGVRHGGAVVHRSRQCLTATVWLVQQLAEDATLSFLSCSRGGGDDTQPTGTADASVLQAVFGLVEELDAAGYLDPNLLSQQHAQDLYTHLRTMRITYGRRQHRHQVQAALLRATGQSSP